MSNPSEERHDALVVRARSALGMSRDDFARLLGFSKRTVIRWESGQSTLAPETLGKLATAVHRKDPALAERIARAGDRTLEELGITRLHPPPEAKAASDGAAPPLPDECLVDAIVCAAADALKVVPEAVRPAVYAAFRRARELRMSAEAVERALRAFAPV